MESLSGSEYFLNQLSDVVANLQSLDAQAIKKRLVRYSNQAISIYDYTTFELKYADGFEMFGLKNEELTMLDIFNTAIPEHREVCGELSGKLIKYVQENPVNPDLNTFNMNYASQHVDGTFMHILFQAKMYETTATGNIKTAITVMTYLPHLRPPKIVGWSVYGPTFEENIDKIVDKGIVSPNHIRARELEVLQLMALGSTMLEISDQLCISDRTVEKHLENLRHRFGCRNSIELIAFAKDMELL